MPLWITVLLATFHLEFCHLLTDSHFKKGTICDVQERVDSGCSRHVTVDRRHSLLACLAKCVHHDSCIGSSVDKDTGNCFIHEWCHSYPNLVTRCAVENTNHDYYYSTRCVYGTWIRTTGSCQCLEGIYGHRCERTHAKCGSLLSEEIEAGFNWVYLDLGQDGKLFRVLCKVVKATGYIATGIFKNSGQRIFNRTWNEYVEGFDIDKYNYWIGLKKWNILSTEFGCGKFVTVLAFDSSNIYRTWYGFKVANESNNFSLTYTSTVGRYTNTPPAGVYFGNCLGNLENIPFSTWDKNNGANEDCASRVGAGWWHTADCDNSCNVMGWGLDDWSNTPIQQRLSVKGVDINTVASQIKYVIMYLPTC